MLLELFGYLSGDARLCEIAEVYHWEMVQVSTELLPLQLPSWHSIEVLSNA